MTVKPFTERARRVLILAQEDAGHYVGTDSLIAAILADKDCSGAACLTALGVTKAKYARVRKLYDGARLEVSNDQDR